MRQLKRAAQIAMQKRKVSSRDDTESVSAPPSKRRAPQVGNPQPQTAARKAAVEAAGIVDPQELENARLQALVDASRQEAEHAKARLASLEGQLAMQIREVDHSRESAADRVAGAKLQAEKERARAAGCN